ncbi:hypothetical protein LXL04_018417 [Taraxacum kok-saghyz]
MVSSLLLLPFPVQIDLPTGLKESSPSRQKSESSPSTQKLTPTAMKFKTEISADCEIEKVVQMVFLLLKHNCKDKLTFTKLASYKAHHHHTQHPPAIIIICWHFRNFRGYLDFYGYDGHVPVFILIVGLILMEMNVLDT